MDDIIKQYSLEYRFRKHRRKRIREYQQRIIKQKKIHASSY